METQKPDLKKVIINALTETRESREKNEKALKRDRKIAGINSIFFIFFFLNMILYPLVTTTFISWIYTVAIICTISLAVLRVKLYMHILRAEIEYAGFTMIEKLLEEDLEKLRTEEYALTRQTVTKGNSIEVPSTTEDVSGSGEDKRSTEN